MSITEMIKNLSNLNKDELSTLNHAVCDQLKTIRNRDAAVKRHLFNPGDSVKWVGRKGHQQGHIVRVKRKNAVVKVGITSWNVPLSMLESA
ncbi:MAG TPA: hypothetical protein EYQ00_02505 [Dehalococcoidia bacterium]|nr:hypothetical protein [Dehalococcoidia bacterium]